jgi:hypothetical protein
MAKSPALLGRIKSFAAKLSDGVGNAVDNVSGNNLVVDNKNNPASATNMMKRKMVSTPVPTSQNAPTGSNQKTYGVPGAK